MRERKEERKKKEEKRREEKRREKKKKKSQNLALPSSDPLTFLVFLSLHTGSSKMSNPFEDSNPFANQEEEGNPFEDSAVVQGADEDPILERKAEDSQGEKKGKEKERGRAFFTNPFSSSLTSPAPSSPENEEISQKEAELQRKEEELKRKQKELERQEKGKGGAQKPNWPICFPFLFHSIKDEIPEEHQRFMRGMYFSWLATVVCLFFNCIGCLTILTAGLGGKDFGFSIMYFFVITPLSFFLWYRPVYNAYMKDTSFYFSIFLVFNACHLLFELYIIMGAPDTGSCGIINMSDLYGKKKIAEAAICNVVVVMWLILFGAQAYFYWVVYRTYRSRGHTFKEAGNQAVSSAAKSDTGRKAFSAAASGAMEGMTSQNRS